MAESENAQQLDSEAQDAPVLVVGVGASAGGLEAFKTLLAALPADTGMAFLLVQHLDPNHKSLLGELLAPHTSMDVQEAAQGLELKRNSVYVIQPDTAMAVEGGRIELTKPTRQRGVRLPVDHLFRSLARNHGSRSVGIVLSGAGSDGSLGLRDIKTAGGLAIAQTPETCGQPGMPQSAISSGNIDLVLDLEDVPEALQRFGRLPLQEPDAEEEEKETEESTSRALRLDPRSMTRLFSLLEAQASFDIRVYKPATVERRILRRMTLVGIDEVEAYFETLRSDPAEQANLLRDMLINVTDFFRDPDAFKALRSSAINYLVHKYRQSETIRIWVPGCATGEEAYSIAMEFLDEISLQNSRVRIQVFATDIDMDALAVGREGLYPSSIADRVPERYLKTYFKELSGSGYRVRANLRDCISFAAHDLTKDPPFSRMDLVSCRNLLIYLTQEVQKQVLSVLHFALNPEGYLFLSTSESTGTHRELYGTVSKTQRLYQKVGSSRPLVVASSRTKSSAARDPERIRDLHDTPESLARSLSDFARRAVVQAFAPPTIVVAADGTVIFSHGELEPFIRFPQGDNPRFELGAILRPFLATRTRAALYKCRRSNEVVVTESSPDPVADRVQIEARPAPELGDEVAIISFRMLTETAAESAVRVDSPEDEAVVEQLERELEATREDLRNTVEELESSNEELRSSNEESMSMNEELQSANEELEATTEELRSLNEELTTVNAQLREKVELVEQANDDLGNFFASSKIAMIFLDESLRIKRFTPAASDLLGIDYNDQGRHVGNIARELLQNEFEEECAAVLEQLSSRSRELQTSDARWFSRQVLPYRTESRRIEGVVVTFVDITKLKQVSTQLGLREKQQRTIAKLGIQALRDLNLQGFMERVVRDVQEILQTDFCKILELQPGRESLLLRVGLGWDDGIVGQSCVGTGIESQAGYTLQAAEAVIVENLETEKRFSGPELLTRHGVKSGLSCVIRDGEQPYGVIGAHSREEREFGREDAYFLQSVAGILGSAVSRHLVRKRLSLEVGIAHELTLAQGLEDGLARLVRRMTNEMDAATGEYIDISQGEADLGRLSFYVAPAHEDMVGLSTSNPGDRQAQRRLIEQVARSQTAIWFTRQSHPEVFELEPGVERVTLSSGLAMPVISREGVIGVVVLHSVQRLIMDDIFLKNLVAVGHSIGEFIRRAELEKRYRRLAAITESSHDAILSYDLEGTITEWLSGSTELFGYTADEIVGKSMSLIVPETEQAQIYEVSRRIAAGENPKPFEARRLHKDGRVLTVSVRSAPVIDIRGRLIGISSTDRDISQQKEFERRLIEADRQKDEFLAMLGHELRNPLAAVRNAAALLGLSDLENSDFERAQVIIQRQTEHMARLLDGLLDVARIIRGKIKIDYQTVDFTKVCRHVLADVESRLAARDLEISSEFPEAPAYVRGDYTRLVQVVDNLLSNAVRYTEDPGKIHLQVSIEGRSIVLSVRDTGVGIAKELLPHIFEIFQQSKQSLDRAQGGMGIGLALVKLLVELHQGSVEVTSEGEGLGSEFTVRLPKSSVAPRVIASHGPARQSFRILIIEDHVDSALVLKMLLVRDKHEVFLAKNGKEGVAMARDVKPDVVLCDLGLPDQMSGFDVAETLRQDPDTSGLVIIAVSGYGRSEDKSRAERSGFDAHLTKPVDPTDVVRVVEDVLRSGRNKRSTQG